MSSATLVRRVVAGHRISAMIFLLSSYAFCEMFIPPPSMATCPGNGPIPESPNVGWVSLPDSVAACPGGDSLVAGHPSRIRGLIFYGDECHTPRVGVPPDSMWIIPVAVEGNLVINDQPNKIFADDSSDANGYARFTLPSVSGCGRLRLRLFVSNVAYDSLTISVRSVDSNADGRVDITTADWTSPCDLNYNGQADDRLLYTYYHPHWHRQALFGTPVKRTTFIPTEGGANAIGDGSISWEPNGDRIVISAHTDIDNTVPCALFTLHSDPKDGNVLTQITHPPGQQVDDYSPSWSPLGDEIAWDRGTRDIWSKRLSTGDSVVVTSSGGGTDPGDNDPSYSPNGEFLAFARNNPATGLFRIHKIELATGQVTMLTNTSGANDRFPSWKSDGSAIRFQRNQSGSTFGVYEVPASGGTVTQLYVSSTRDATYPSESPDSKILFTTVTNSSGSVPKASQAVDLVASTPTGIANYLDFKSGSSGSDGALHPVISPDGTRLAFTAPVPNGASAKQLWAVRRNMDSPPTLTAIGNKTVHVGNLLQFTIYASDPEGSALTYSASPLKTGMTLVDRTFSWQPGTGLGGIYYVRFGVTEDSGGADWEVVKITVTPLPEGPQSRRGGATPLLSLANPSQFGFSLSTPSRDGAKADLLVYGPNGRLIAHETGASGQPLRWDPNEGVRSLPGVYFYVLSVGDYTERGKWVVVR